MSFDPMKTTEEQRRAIEKFNQNKQMLQSLSDIAVMAQEVIMLMDDQKKDSTKSTKEMGALLTDMRESLAALKDKKDPETPDYAKPVVEAVNKLEKALAASIKAIDVKPNVKVDAPQVSVDSPSVSVDLKGVEKVLKTDLPKAFKESMKLIPKPEKFDPKPLLDAYKQLGKKLDDIDTGVRMKQAGVNAKITNFSDMPDISINTTGLATSAKQDAIIGHLDGVEGLLGTIDTDTGNIATNTSNTVTELQDIETDVEAGNTSRGATSDAAATAGSTGTIQAKLRLMTSQLDAVKTAVETLDNAISGSEMQVDVVGALPAGNNNIGDVDVASLPALPAGTNNIGDVDVLSSVSSTLDHGSNRDIDTTAEQITTTSFACKFGVTLKADITNTGIIYVGNSDVTAGTTAGTDGFPLSAGETLTIEVTNANIPYAIASVANQIIYWVAV